MTGLYIIEGLPCSGKSTTARFVAETLSAAGRNAVFVDEDSGNHPADYEFSAFIPESELPTLPERIQRVVMENSEQTAGGFVLPLEQVEGGDFERLLKYKIYDFLPWETEKPIMLKKWERFAGSADRNAVYVFNCVLLQNPMCETMMRFGFPKESSRDYISEIAEIIKPLNPTVIYLKNDDIARRVKVTAEERSGWLDGVIDYHVNGGYGKSIQAAGFDGYIKCLEERQRRELDILKTLPVKSLVLENAHRDWNGAYEKIRGLLADDK